MDAYKNLLALRNKAAAQAKANDKGATFVTDPAAANRLHPNSEVSNPVVVEEFNFCLSLVLERERGREKERGEKKGFLVV